MLQQQSSESITQKSGSNLALSFVSLPEEKKEAMSTFYAFCRVVDDIVDDKEKEREQKETEIEAWQKEIHACYTGDPETSLGTELSEIVRKYLIPPDPIQEILQGVRMDISKCRYQNFSELEQYCYRVASAVGLVSINIFEYKSPQTRDYAISLGMAFQLTNILRDVRFDLEEYDRIYLPADEMATFGVREEDLLDGGNHEGCGKLFRLQYHRAHHYYRKAARLLSEVDRPNMVAADIMTGVYFNLLEKLKKKNFGLGKKPVRLSKWEKIVAIRNTKKRIKKEHRKLAPVSRIAVMGGGFAGIAAAIRLAKEGHWVEIFEAKSYLGGRAHSFTDAKTGLSLDNGQHILMGCYRSCLELIEHLGVEYKLERPPVLHVPYESPQHGRTSLKASRLPAPFHLLSALIGASEMSWADRLSIVKMGLSLRWKHPPNDRLTVENWLHRERQTPNAIRVLWEPLCLAALNEPLRDASAKLFYQVLKRSLFGDRFDSSILISKVGLSELLMPEAEVFLRRTGGEIHFGTGVKELHFSGKRVVELVTTEGGKREFDYFVSCMPWNATAKLLAEENGEYAQRLSRITSSPIISIHILCDCQIIDESFVGLLDSPIHWIFDRSDHLSPENRDDFLYCIVMSAAHEWIDRKSDELTDFVWSEINRFFPATQDGQIKHRVVYKSRDATFAAKPEIDPLRPPAQTPWENLFVAGDWVQTGLPATLESAVLSTEQLSECLDASFAERVK